MTERESTPVDVHGEHLDHCSLSQTKRHKPCLIYRGHRYVQDKIQNRTVYWRCEDRAHCNGRAHQLRTPGSLPILTIKHNHLPIVEDLLRYDVITIDSHRRRQRQNQKLFFQQLNGQVSGTFAERVGPTASYSPFSRPTRHGRLRRLG